MNVRATPNDPKLSDGGAWRGSCEGGAQKEATDVGQRWLGGKTPKPESAAAVTRGAVRCSAWLGVSAVVISGFIADPAVGTDESSLAGRESPLVLGQNSLGQPAKVFGSGLDC